MKKTEKKYQKFEADVIAMPALRMVLSDIPEPDPGVKKFRSNQIAARKVLLKNSDALQRLIKHMAKKE
ncbi:MAG: hypothetical protein HN392_06520 [Anaerolineae bacterium]|jgi:hypothetical protein|nr:hypothetical protein [Anaerolineae bacterium]MBT7076036.1 hypothetical protein [Anaerolineae bacterium]MBT7782450.1 hypothetical protein [Anaerolineae bacterium]